MTRLNMYCILQNRPPGCRFYRPNVCLLLY